MSNTSIVGPRLSRRTLLALSAAGMAAAPILAAVSPTTSGHKVIELRQYKIVPGKRDAMIALFEREFVDSQESLGMRLVGQFRNQGDPNRFTWIREFTNMEARGKALNDFYFGPVWQAHRNEANPMLDDNDNVLLLRAAIPGFDFGALARAPGTPAGLVVASIHYLWKAPGEGFAQFFADAMRPALEAAGLPALAAYVPEEAPNNFPRLPVRQGEKLFVWFTRADDSAAYARAEARLAQSAGWRDAIAARLADQEERAAQVLMLEPTPRSRLR